VLAFGILSGVFKAAMVAMVLCNSGSGSVAIEEEQHGSLHHSPGGKSENCEICHLCGAGSEGAQAPLWDLATKNSKFQCYAGQAGEGTPSAVSLVCLSCHDGVIAADPPTSDGWPASNLIAGGTNSRILEIEPDNEFYHHPYSVEYPWLWDSSFKPSVGGHVGVLPLHSPLGYHGPETLVECATCHDIHSSVEEAFLRISAKQNELCLCCHNEVPALTRHVYLKMQKKDVKSDDCRSCHKK
jgi:predicted CXXCH cytochrome family protein